MTQYIPHFIALLAGGLVAYATGSYIFVMLDGERISWRVKIAVAVFVMAGSSGLIAFLFRELALEIAMFYALGYVYGSNSPSGEISFIFSDVAGLFEMTPGPIRSLSEDISSSGAAAPAGGRIALASLVSPGLYRFFGNAGSTATTSMNEVEIAISLKAAFALEPAR